MAYRSLASNFAALGDPTRQQIIERLAARPQAVGELARGLPVSRPAVSQHLKQLKDAGLVTDQAIGTRRIYRLDPRGIGAMREWLDAHWNRTLADFKHFADELAEKEDDKS
jgi:DNA-binding transcriptional ArsR family regulator